MKKKIITLLITGALAISVTACGSEENNSSDGSSGNATSNDSSENKEPSEIAVTESGYSISDDGYGNVYVNYSATLNNPNADVAAQFPVIKITAKATDNSIVASYDQTLLYIAPNDSVTFGSLMDCNGIVPATVEITASSGNFIPGNSENIVHTSNLSVSNTSEIPGSFGDTSYTGEIENTGDKDLSNVAVTVTLKNNGTIVYGATTYISNLTAGSKQAFELTAYNVPDHTEFIITAQNWS